MIPSRMVVVGNLVEGGPNTAPAIFSVRGPVELFMEDNLGFGHSGQPMAQVKGRYTKLDQKPFWPEGLTALPADQVKHDVARSAGARPWDRDPIDRPIVQAALQRQGRIIDSEKDGGGYPDRPATRAPFHPADWDPGTLQPLRPPR
jgi:hypothetical protein